MQGPSSDNLLIFLEKNEAMLDKALLEVFLCCAVIREKPEQLNAFT